jgi:hypothetical protein
VKFAVVTANSADSEPKVAKADMPANVAADEARKVGRRRLTLEQSEFEKLKPAGRKS